MPVTNMKISSISEWQRYAQPLLLLPPAPSPPQLLIHILVGLLQCVVNGVVQGIEIGPDYGRSYRFPIADLCLRLKKRRKISFSLTIERDLPPRFFGIFLDVFLLKLSGV